MHLRGWPLGGMSTSPKLSMQNDIHIQIGILVLFLPVPEALAETHSDRKKTTIKAG